MKELLATVALATLLTGCLHFPLADEKCDLTCYGLEAIENKWCLGIFNYNQCGGKEDK